jgi:hypothetical protein
MLHRWRINLFLEYVKDCLAYGKAGRFRPIIWSLWKNSGILKLCKFDIQR